MVRMLLQHRLCIRFRFGHVSGIKLSDGEVQGGIWIIRVGRYGLLQELLRGGGILPSCAEIAEMVESNGNGAPRFLRCTVKISGQVIGLRGIEMLLRRIGFLRRAFGGPAFWGRV